MFANYNIETKNVNNQAKARIAIIDKKSLPYQRCTNLEDDDLSSIVIKSKKQKPKIYLLLVATMNGGISVAPMPHPLRA